MKQFFELLTCGQSALNGKCFINYTAFVSPSAHTHKHIVQVNYKTTLKKEEATEQKLTTECI